MRLKEDDLLPRLADVLTGPLTDRQRKRLKIVLWIVAVLLGVLHVWSVRHTMGADGVSYVDIADAYIRRDWSTAINSWWSPLYPWLLSLALLVIKPSPYWEYTVVHFVNLGIYLSALICFDFFLRELIRFQRSQADSLSTQQTMVLPEWSLLVLGYASFVWSSLSLITLEFVSPDLCVAAFVYLASGIMLRIVRGSNGLPTFVLLGVVLGFAYLAKAPMFPLAFIFLAVSAFSVRNIRRSATCGAVGLVCFFLVAGPFLVALSRSKGRVTFGDTANVNYAWYVNGIPARHWQGGPPGSGMPVHTPRKIFDTPRVFEFGEAVGGTYPVWYDPSYWYEGIKAHFDLRGQVKNFMLGVRTYYATFIGLQGFVFDLHGSLTLGLLILFVWARRGWLTAKDILGQWHLLVPTIAALGGYLLVHVELRYIAPFVVLLFIGLLASVRLRNSEESYRLVASVTIAVAAIFFVSIVPATTRAASSALRDIINQRDTVPNEYWQVAEDLSQMGVQRGDKAATISDSKWHSKWAHLAKVHIVAEIAPGGNIEFWLADPSVKTQIIEAFAKAGANIIVTDKLPPIWAQLDGWQRIGNSDCYVYFLGKEGAPPSPQ